MTISDLQPEHPVSLVVTVGIKSKDLNTTVKEVQKDYVLLSPILINERTVGFGDECVVDLLYVSEQSVFSWNKVNIKLVKRKGETFYQTFLPGEAVPYNRRGAYRVYIGENMAITLFQSNGPQTHNVLIRDISETGFGFVSREECDVSRAVRLMLALNERKSLSLSATIIRKEFQEDRGIYNYGCRFAERNDILSAYLMIKQREKQQAKNAVPVKLTGIHK